VGNALKQAPKAAADVEGRSRLAGIINGLDPEEAEDAMRALEQARPKDAAIVKTMLFSFNDLPRLSERARALLFDRASIDIVVWRSANGYNFINDCCLLAAQRAGI
jgi:flagellar motor switch protein FliG